MMRRKHSECKKSSQAIRVDETYRVLSLNATEVR